MWRSKSMAPSLGSSRPRDRSGAGARCKTDVRAAGGGEGGIRTLEAGQPRPRDFQSRSLSHSDTSPCRPPRVPRAASQAQVANSDFVPAEVVREFVAEGALDLARQQLGVVSEVALERVLV